MNFTPNLLQDNCFIIDYLKKANIRTIAFGLESGSLELRKKLHRPYYENEQFIEFCNKLRENNITTMAFVMYCYPFETKETYKATIDCLLKSKINYVSYTWLTPYKGTLLYDETQKQYKDAPLIDKWRYLTFKIRLMPIFFNDIKNIIFSYIRRNMKENTDNINNKNINLAKQELDKGNYKKAIKYFNKISVRTDNYWVYGDRAIAKMNIGDYSGAIKDFDKILKLEPNEIYKQKRQECLNLLIKK
jgi:radical SAM superfamily enzyme YgiQ (UPF0313 family)